MNVRGLDIAHRPSAPAHWAEGPVGGSPVAAGSKPRLGIGGTGKALPVKAGPSIALRRRPIQNSSQPEARELLLATLRCTGAAPRPTACGSEALRFIATIAFMTWPEASL